MGLLILYLLTGAVFALWGNRKLRTHGLSILIPFRFLAMVHGLYLAYEWMGMGPLTKENVLQAMAFSLTVLYLMSLRRGESQGLLWIIWPLLIFFLFGAAIAPEENMLRGEVSGHAQSIFIHILLALLGYASFFLVTLCSFIYLLQSRLLKVNSNSPWLGRFPSLLELTEIIWRALTLGLVFFTLAIGLGKLSPYLWDVPHKWSAKEVLSVMTWTLFLALLLGKKYFRQRKEVLAYVSLAGCILLLLTLFVLNVSPVSLGEVSH